MERKVSPPPLIPERLTEILEKDYPTAEVVVSFPDQWQFIGSFNRGDRPLYIAAFPASREPVGDRFRELSPAINHSLTEYWLYKLFEPWPQPLLQVEWNSAKDKDQVVGEAGLRVQVHPIGQAQVWKGETCGVLWECYVYQARRRQHWQAELAHFWQVVEQDMNVRQIFTTPNEPTIADGYSEFLSQLGYAPDQEFEHWWSKELKSASPHTIVEV